MSLFDLIINLFAVKSDCKVRYKREVHIRVQELIDACRLEV